MLLLQLWMPIHLSSLWYFQIILCTSIHVHLQMNPPILTFLKKAHLFFLYIPVFLKVLVFHQIRY